MTLTLLKKLFTQPPPGYRPGHTLSCVLSDLRGVFSPQTVESAEAIIVSRDGDVSLHACERVERHFQMHIVSLELRCTVQARAEPGISIDLRTTGMLFRTGITCSVPSRHRDASKEVSERIMNNPELTRLLMSLDFRRCRLESSEQGWQVMIEPYGASEVVSRMPSFRRYIRIEKQQVETLAQVFGIFRRLLEADEG
jgi:hypothetical protein